MSVYRVFYAVVAPRWRARHLVGELLARRWLRWQVVRETVYPSRDGVTPFGYETVSTHWTRRAAVRAREGVTPIADPGETADDDREVSG